MSLPAWIPGVSRIRALEDQRAVAKSQVRSLRGELAAQKALTVERKARAAEQKALVSRGIDARALKAVLTGDGRHDRSADPFPHVVIDSFLKPDLLRRRRLVRPHAPTPCEMACRAFAE